MVRGTQRYMRVENKIKVSIDVIEYPLHTNRLQLWLQDTRPRNVVVYDVININLWSNNTATSNRTDDAVTQICIFYTDEMGKMRSGAFSV